MSKNKISVLLIKECIKENDIIKSDAIPCVNVSGRKFYYKSSEVCAPKWVENFFLKKLECGDNLKSSSVQGVLIVKVKIKEEDDIERIFAVTFGHGRNLINPSCMVERFGLITTLNCIDPEKIRSINYRNIDSIPISGQIQSSKLSGIQNFEINTERNFLKSATGKMSGSILGNIMTGADSLSITTDVNIDNIEDVLVECYKRYKSEKYLTHFGWIDNLYLVKDKQLISSLDNELVEIINKKEFGKVWMSIPDLINWENADHFKLLPKDKENYDDIEISTVFDKVFKKEIVDVSCLEENKVYLYDNDDKCIKSWSYYKCLSAELELNNKCYILDGGNWTEVADSFNREVSSFYEKMNLSNIDIPQNTQKTSEKAYNEELSSLNEKYCLMDCKH